MDDLEGFRLEVRRWIAESCPPSMRTPAAGEQDEVWGGRRAVFAHPDQKLWLDRAAARGFTAPTWPREYGGAGLSPAEATVLDAELRDAGCRPPLRSLGLWMLGPVIFRFGNEDQKREHLPRIARGEIRWCQGYSEPGAGSDLASLSTRAALDPAASDTYVVDGQKTWTSHADRADWMFCLVRTDTAAPKHEGIGFLLIDMESPGVRVRPIKLISGSSPFCETFFDQVSVPARNLVGAPGQGWTIAKALLEHERSSIGNLRSVAFAAEEPLQDLARRYLGDEGGRLPDPILRDRVTQANLDQLAYQLTSRRAAETTRARKSPGPESSVLKLYGMELNKRRKELRVVMAGFSGLGAVPVHDGGTPQTPARASTAEELDLTRDWLRSRANSIEGGTTEVQLNIIAKRILGLPD